MRHKDADWSLNKDITSWQEAEVGLLMDLRDELKALNSKLECWRVSQSLNALMELGVKLRREERARRKRRKRK